jgi:hypothetical protein
MSDARKDYGPRETVTKLEGARRQLHTAIRLFFAVGDLVSMQTLACASHEVLRTLVKAKGGGGSQLKDSEYIKPDQRKAFGELLNRPSNFLQHAGRDPDDVLTIYHRFCHVWLLDCCIMYQQMTGKYSRECAVFVAWFSIEYPNYLVADLADRIQGFLDSAPVTRRALTKELFLMAIQEPSSFPLPISGPFEQ